MKGLLLNVGSVLFIRWKQMHRAMFQVGVFRLAILAILCAFLLLAVYMMSDITQTYIVGGAWILIISFIHMKREDKIFLYIGGFNQLVYIAEYTLLSIPLVSCFLLRRQWMVVGVILLCVLVISFMGVNQRYQRRQKKTRNTRIQQYIPSHLYEWKAGIREYFYPIVIVWTIGLCISFFVAGAPIAIGIIGLLLSGFYERYESWPMLMASSKRPSRFLLYKTGKHILLFGMIVLPLGMAFVIFHPDVWYILAIELVVILSVHIYGIVLKYAFYSHEKSRVRPVLFLIGFLIGIIPPTTPVLWVFTCYFFYKACINLNFYLDDYN